MHGPRAPGRPRAVVIPDDVRGAVESADTDTLLRAVDGMCAARDWDRLLELRALCREAVGRGRQVWAIDEHIRYRLALEAPPDRAAAALAGEPTRFTLGPLTEVVAATHTWADLAPHLPPGPERDVVAHERVIRGDAVSEPDAVGTVVELPLTLAGWEPSYPVARYLGDRAEFPSPTRPAFDRHRLPSGAETLDDPETVDALLALVTPWQDESTGRVEAVAVEGGPSAAIGALGPSEALLARIEPAAAFAWMAWAGASGGARGRRRGAAHGRFGAWWAATALAGLEWPPDPDALGRAVTDLEWFLWSDGADLGWTLRLAVADPADGIAWAITAVDQLPS